MRVLIVALLAAISYAQTELAEEDEDDDSDFWLGWEEAPVAGFEHVRKKFKHVIQICAHQRSITIMPNPALGLQEQITVTFLEALDAGVYGAVVKANATTRDSEDQIAFKMFTNNKRGERIGTQKEIDIMEYLSRHMPEVCHVKLGPIMHEFNMDGIQYHGFGMELFEHPTIHGYFKGLLKQVADDVPSRVAFLLDDGPLRKLYGKCMAAIKKMWLLGIIHCDLHINNILYDVSNDVIKIIDFGMSFRPSRTEETQFQLGTVYDYVWFTKSFVRWVMYPHGMSSKRDEAQVHSIMIELSPELSSFSRGQLPQTQEFAEIYQSFLDRFGLTTSRRAWAAGIKYASLGKAPKFELNESLQTLSLGQPGEENTNPVPGVEHQTVNVQDDQPGKEIASYILSESQWNVLIPFYPKDSFHWVFIVALFPSICILKTLRHHLRNEAECLLDVYEEI